MKYLVKLSIFIGAMILNWNVFKDLTPTLNVNIGFIIILSLFVVFSLNCKINENN